MKRFTHDDVIALFILAGGLFSWFVLFAIAWEACE
jgi:hypothetical protein